MNLHMKDNEMFCFEASLLLLPHSPHTGILHELVWLLTQPLSAISVVTGLWTYLGAYKQIPKSHWLQTKNVVTGCGFLLSSWIRGTPNGFKNLRCQVKLLETRIKTFMHISWHNEKFDMVLEKKINTVAPCSRTFLNNYFIIFFIGCYCNCLSPFTW